MRRIRIAFAFAAFLVAGWIPRAFAQKTEAGLISAWEQAQKSDPATIQFEKTRDREYQFATKRFPFDGYLLVRNVAIEDFSAVNQAGISMGTVEVELQGTNEEFHRTFARSYAQWNLSNTLYWDPKKEQWLTSEKYFQGVRGRISDYGSGPAQAVLPALLEFGWLGVLVVIFGFLFFSLWRYNARIKVINQRSERMTQISERNGQIAERNGQIAERNAQIIEQGLKLQEENAKVFQEILAELKKLSARP